MTCPVCGGAGCSACRHGQIEIDRCPLELIDGDTWELLDAAVLYEKGLPPVAGGALDQTAYLIAAAAWIFNEIAYWKRKAGSFDE